MLFLLLVADWEPSIIVNTSFLWFSFFGATKNWFHCVSLDNHAQSACILSVYLTDLSCNIVSTYLGSTFNTPFELNIQLGNCASFNQNQFDYFGCIRLDRSAKATRFRWHKLWDSKPWSSTLYCSNPQSNFLLVHLTDSPCNIESISLR